jgi:hypothetical protein
MMRLLRILAFVSVLWFRPNQLRRGAEFEVVGLVMEPPVVPLAADPAQNPLVDRSSTPDLVVAKFPVSPI